MSGLSSVFEKRIGDYLMAANRQLAGSLIGRDSEQRPSLNYFHTDETPTVADPDTFFSTEEVGKLFLAATTKAGRASAKMQNDLIASLKRSFIAENTTRIRAITLEASKRQRQSEPDGPINMCVTGPAKRLAGDGPNGVT